MSEHNGLTDNGRGSSFTGCHRCISESKREACYDKRGAVENERAAEEH